MSTCRATAWRQRSPPRLLQGNDYVEDACEENIISIVIIKPPLLSITIASWRGKVNYHDENDGIIQDDDGIIQDDDGIIQDDDVGGR